MPASAPRISPSHFSTVLSAVLTFARHNGRSQPLLPEGWKWTSSGAASGFHYYITPSYDGLADLWSMSISRTGYKIQAAHRDAILAWFSGVVCTLDRSNQMTVPIHREILSFEYRNRYEEAGEVQRARLLAIRAQLAAQEQPDEEAWARHAANRRAAEEADRLAVEAPQELVLEECVADCDDPQPCEPESITA